MSAIDTPTDSTKTAKPKQKPYIKDGVAVFDKMIPDKNGGQKHIYEFADDQTGLKYISCPSNILGYHLTKDDVVELYRNATLVVEAPKTLKEEGAEPSSYDLLLGSTGIEETPSKKDPRYTNRRLNVVTGFPLRGKVADTATDEERRNAPIDAYLVSETQGGKRDVKFYRYVGPKKNPVKLELGDCYRLLSHAKFVSNGCEVTLDQLKEGTPFKMATVKARILSNEEKAALAIEESKTNGKSQEKRPSRSI